jgi:hypothetical protein
MVSKGRIAVLIVLIIISAIAVVISFIYLTRSYEKMNRANEKTRIACVDLRDSLVNVLRALQQMISIMVIVLPTVLHECPILLAHKQEQQPNKCN